MTLPVRIAFNEEKSAILIKPPTELMRVRARNQPGVTSFGPISCDDTVREYRAKTSGCAREVNIDHVHITFLRGIGKEGKTERERFSLLWLSPFSLLEGHRELMSSCLSDGQENLHKPIMAS